MEMIVALGLFGIIGTILAFSFAGAGDVWRTVSGSSEAQINLSKARDRLTRDLKRTSFDSGRVGSGLTSLGAEDGTLIWFLSPVDPVTGQVVRTNTGAPFWQRNIIYYLAVPQNHVTLFGFTCSGGADPDGFEVQCPHKVLIRKVVDGGGVTDPADESTIEQPLTAAEAVTYLSRPNGFDTQAMMSEPGVSDVSIPATGLLSMQAQIAPDPKWPREVHIDLSSVSVLTAQRELAIGKVPLNDTRFTNSIELQIFPGLP